MYAWEKLGHIFDPGRIENRPYWLFEYAQAPWTILFEDFVRVYFSSRAERDKQGQCVSYAAFVDLDRKNLFNILNIASRPILELGSRGAFDEFGTYPVSVLRDGDEYKVYYTGHTRCVSVPFDTAIGLGVSTDGGESFVKAGSGPVLPRSPFEPFVISGPKIKKVGDTYFLYYISGMRWFESHGRKEVVYKIRLATSGNGVDWTRLGRNLIPDKLGENEVQASPDVISKDGRNHMFFCYMLTPDFRTNHAFSYRIGYASSTDLIHWERDDDKAGIDVSKDGFDNEMVAYPHVFELDGSVYMLYLGNQTGRYGFGLARLKGAL